MQIPKICSTFALVIELARHIEILLLSNDCVIVPGLGGFVAHHVDASYDESEQLFLPPLRSIGFNAKLKINDSLLAQSYVEAYDISYPDALIRIEEEVKELNQHLNTEGYYELNGIGTLELNEEGSYVFKPCEAGILTPELYGLSSFEMKPLVSESTNSGHTQTGGEGAIVIKMSWIRNVAAAAAAIVAFFLFTSPAGSFVSDNSHLNKAEFAIGKNEAAPAPAKTKVVADLATSSTEKTPSTEQAPSTTTNSEKALVETKTEKAPVETKKEKAAEHKVTPQESGYCLVLASCVAKANAEDFVKRLHRAGFMDARVYEHNNIRRVIYGHYTSQNEAYNDLRAVQVNSNFKEAWVYHIKYFF